MDIGGTISHLDRCGRSLLRILLLHALDALRFMVDLAHELGLVQPVDDRVLTLRDVH